jgi:hypothetical protein
MVLINYETEIFTLRISFSGLASGTSTYTCDADFNLSITGEYDGQVIDLSE